MCTDTPLSSFRSSDEVLVSDPLAVKLCITVVLTPSPVYIFAGSILLHDGVLRYIAGSIIGFIGLGYVVLEYIPSIEPPSNMREADNSWGAEQV